MVKLVDVTPPKELMETYQNQGYDFEVAIADILDNSITAKATCINLNFSWNSGFDANIAISDNGSGMDETDLINAMTLAFNYRKERDSGDLGRFGLGLKSGGFALGNKITVLSKKLNEKIVSCQWDLTEREDTMGNTSLDDRRWLIPFDIDKSSLVEEYSNRLSCDASGTVVIIEKLRMDMPKNAISKAEASFNDNIEKTDHYLALVYHRFLDADSEQPIKIIINDVKEVIAWNPFFSHPATQELPARDFEHNGEIIKIRPYVMPRPSKLTEEEQNELSGPYAMHELQGFYVYRNNRLISFGKWLNTTRPDSGNILARIAVDIPSSLDFEWSVDIKKSKVNSPTYARSALKGAMTESTLMSRKIINSHESYHRGDTSVHPGAIWEQNESRPNLFGINKNHFFYKKIREALKTNSDRKLFDTYLIAIANSYPPLQACMFGNKKEDTELDKLEILKDKENLKQCILDYKAAGCCMNDIKETLMNYPEFDYLKKEMNGIFEELK